MSLDYININKSSWNNKVDIHLSSEFYNQEGFLKVHQFTTVEAASLALKHLAGGPQQLCYFSIWNGFKNDYLQFCSKNPAAL